MASKPGYKLETPVLDRGDGGKRAPNSLNNGDKPETTVLDRGDSRQRLAQTDSHRQPLLIEFKY